MTFEQIKTEIKNLQNEVKNFPKYNPKDGGNIFDLDTYRNKLADRYNNIMNEMIAFSNSPNSYNINEYQTQVLSLKFCELDAEKIWLKESQKMTDLQIKELQDAYNIAIEDKKILFKEIRELKNNLFNFAGLIVGLLAFIFVNYQFISSAKDLGIGKMIMFMGIANVGLICGILIILGILGDLLGQSKKLKNSYRILRSGWLFLGIITIIGLGFSTIALVQYLVFPLS